MAFDTLHFRVLFVAGDEDDAAQSRLLGDDAVDFQDEGAGAVDDFFAV